MKPYLVAALAAAAAVSAVRPARAQQQELTPAQHAAARDLVAAANDSANFYRSFMMGFFGSTRGRLSAADSAAAMPQVQKWLDRYLPWSDLEPDLERIYAAHYTEEEMQAIAAFLRSPAGRKMAAVAPSIFQESARVSQSRAMIHLPELAAAIEAVTASSARSGKPATSP